MDYELAVFDKLTICIFTNGKRKTKLVRTVMFIEKLGISCIILDAGLTPTEHSFASTTNYNHTPGRSGEERLMDFSKLVKTKYILLSPDDDFFLPNGLDTCIKFLEEHHNYASVQGQRVYFNFNKYFVWGPSYVKQILLNFDQEDKKDRLLLMSERMHYIYSIMRTEVYAAVVEALQGTKSNNYNSILKNELVFNYLLPLYGAHTLLPVLFSARERHPYEHSEIEFGKWILDYNDLGSRKFKENIRKQYQYQLNITASEAVLIESRLTKYFTRDRNTPLPGGNILKYPLRSMKQVIRRVIRNYRAMSYPKLQLITHLARLSNQKYFWAIVRGQNVFKFYKDLVTLEKHLRESQE